MKRCPECGRDYYDDTLLYCLDDGNALLEGPATASGGDEPATAILHSTAAPGETPTHAQIHTTAQTAILPSQYVTDLGVHKRVNRSKSHVFRGQRLTFVILCYRMFQRELGC